MKLRNFAISYEFSPEELRTMMLEALAVGFLAPCPGMWVITMPTYSTSDARADFWVFPQAENVTPEEMTMLRDNYALQVASGEYGPLQALKELRAEIAAAVPVPLDELLERKRSAVAATLEKLDTYRSDVADALGPIAAPVLMEDGSVVSAPEPFARNARIDLTVTEAGLIKVVDPADDEDAPF